MDVIDERGRLFGRVNVIDALAVLLVVAVAAAGVALVTGGVPNATGAADESIDDPEPVETTVVVRVERVEPYVADAIAEGPVERDGVLAVAAETTEAATVIVEDDAGRLREVEHPRQRTVTLELVVNATATEDDLLFRGEPLRIGDQLSLDLGDVVVEGPIVDIHG